MSIDTCPRDIKLLLIGQLDSGSKSALGATSKGWYRLVHDGFRRDLKLGEFECNERFRTIQELMRERDGTFVETAKRIFLEKIQPLRSTTVQLRALFRVITGGAEFPADYMAKIAEIASERGFLGIVQKTVKVESSRSCLVVAAAKGHLHIVKELMDSFHFDDFICYMASKEAVINEHVDVVKLLYTKHQINLLDYAKSSRMAELVFKSVPNIDDLYSLKRVCELGCTSVVSKMLKRKKWSDKDLEYTLTHAARKGFVEIVERLSDACEFSVETKGYAIWQAAEFNQAKVISVLLRGTSFEENYRFIRWALDEAIEHDNPEIIRLLKSYVSFSDDWMEFYKRRAQTGSKLEALAALEEGTGWFRTSVVVTVIAIGLFVLLRRRR